MEPAESLSIEVRGRVVGKQRPRFRGHAYTSEATREAERAIRDAWVAAHGSRPDYRGPVRVLVSCGRELARTSPKRNAGMPDTSRPDIDNVCKLVMDALSGVAWRDDSQVVSLEAHKLARRPHGAGDVTYVTVTYYEAREEK